MAITTATGGNRYTVGNDIVITADITRDGVPLDPASVVLRVEKPDASIVTPTPSNTGPGVYEATVLADLEGLYEYRWETTGPAGAAESWFVVPASRLP